MFLSLPPPSLTVTQYYLISLRNLALSQGLQLCSGRGGQDTEEEREKGQTLSALPDSDFPHLFSLTDITHRQTERQTDK